MQSQAVLWYSDTNNMISYNTIFKIKYTLCIATVSAFPHPSTPFTQWKILDVHFSRGIVFM